VEELIFEEILLQVRWEETSLPFSMLIAKLCERAGVPFQGETNVKITLVSSSDVQRIEVEYLRDDAAWKKSLPPDSTLVVSPATLAPETSTHAPFVEQAGISTPSFLVGSSFDASVQLVVASTVVRSPPSSVFHPPCPRF